MTVWRNSQLQLILFLFGLVATMSTPVRSALAAEGDAEQQIQEHFRLGEADWKKSCVKPSEDGACVRVTPGAARRARCGPENATASDLTVIDRDKKRAASAKKHFESAVKLWNEGSQQTFGAPTATAAAGALFYLAEGQYETLLRTAAPTNLETFSGYLDEKSRAITAARDAYLEAFKIRRVPWNVAAAARVGQSYGNFVQQLRSIAIPKDLTGKPEARGVYCNAMEDKAGPMAGKAIEAYEVCLKTAGENDGRGSWSELCERELGRLKPARPAPAAEPKPAGPVPSK